MMKIVLTHYKTNAFRYEVKYNSVIISSVEISQSEYDMYASYLEDRFNEAKSFGGIPGVVDRHVFYLGSPKISRS